AESNGTLASYYKDHKDEYMYLNFYNAIIVNRASTYVEHAAKWARGLKRHRNDNLSMSESILLLTNFIFEKENIGNNLPIVTFSQLKVSAIDKNDQLDFFFNEIEEMACLEKKKSLNEGLLNSLWHTSDELAASDDNLSWLINSNLTAFKKDISLFVDLMGVSAEAIDALSYAGLTISQRHLNREKIAIANNHLYRVASYLEAKKNNIVVHITTLLLNGVDSIAIPQVTTGSISIHNPNLVDSNLICNFLDSVYIKRIAKTFNDQFYYEVPLNKKLENMTLHKYDFRIQEHLEEHKMKDTILLDFFELSLKEINSYIFALQKFGSELDLSHDFQIQKACVTKVVHHARKPAPEKKKKSRNIKKDLKII
ncbi:4515_t:CDS:2, partial [Scutellospora calospora]